MLQGTKSFVQGLDHVLMKRVAAVEQGQELQGLGGVELFAENREQQLLVLSSMVASQVHIVAGVSVGPDAVLLDAGVDSLAAIELRNSLQRELGTSVNLPATLLTDHPTSTSISIFVTEQLVQATASVPKAVTTVSSAELVLPTVITGASCRAAAGTLGLNRFWTELCSGECLVSPLPPQRWADGINAAVGPIDDSGIMSGAFMDRIDMFDHSFFRLPSGRAEKMDCNERVLAEVMLEATTEAGYLAQDPLLREAAVITSVTSSDFEQHGTYEITVARHIAKLLNANGSFENVNTICSR